MDESDLADLFERSQLPDTSPSPVPQPRVPVQDIKILGAEDMAEDIVVMEDSEIDNILQNHIRNATTWVGSQIATQQAKAMKYYLGLPEGDLSPPGIQGRSTFVDTTVSDQIEWIMPALMELFYASANIVKFTPRKASDTAAAKQMTALANHVINDLNPGFEVFASWFKNALLNKVGVAKVWWEQDTTHTRETYTGITDEQLAILSDDDECVISSIVSYVDPAAEAQAMAQQRSQQQAIEQYNKNLPMMKQALAHTQQQMALHAQQQPQGMPPQPGAPAAAPQAPGPAQAQGPQGQPPGAPPQPPQLPPPPPAPQPIDVSNLPQMHNVVMTRSPKAGHVAIDAMNPEDFLIDETSKRVGDGFSAHRIIKTISQLRAEGYQNVDDIDLDQLSSDQEAETIQNSEVLLARDSLQSIYKPQELEEYGDESMRKVWLYECYVKMDCDGDGIAEWRKIVRAGNALLENEVCDGPPFATICPIPIPGLFFGRSVAELGMPMQYARTGLVRSLIDNVSIQVNGRTWAVESQVNIDDLLTNRPGGVVRVKSAQAVGPLAQGMMDSQGAYQLLEFLDQQSQERTGITKYTQGTDADMINPTATAYKGITQRSDLRVKLIARTFAETGVKDLCRLIQKLLCKYQDKAMTFELNGNWVDVNPRVWNNQYSMKANVGLGTGDQTVRVQNLQLIGTAQQAGATIGISSPQLMYNTACELIDALNMGDPSQFFVAPPDTPPQAPPNPDMVKVQGQLQLEQAKAKDAHDLAILKAQLDAQNEDKRQQVQMQIEQNKQNREYERQAKLDAENQAWEREKFYAQIASQNSQAVIKAGADANIASRELDLLEQNQNAQNFLQAHGQIADQQVAMHDSVTAAQNAAATQQAAANQPQGT